MTDTTQFRPALGVGGLISSSFSLVFRNFVPMLILGGVPALIGVMMNLAVFGSAQQNMLLAVTDPELYAATVQYVSPITQGLVMLVGIVLWGIAIAAVTAGAYRALTGGSINTGRALSIALSRFFPLILCMIVTGIAVYLGIIALLLPGLYLMALWFVIVPAIVVEGRFFDSLGRSAALTKDYRWPLVGLIVIFLLIMTLMTAVSAAAQGFGFAMGTIGLILANVIGVAVGGFFYALAGALGALTYARLVDIKEGTGISSLAEVFS